MVLGFVNVGDEAVGDQKVINGHGFRAVFDVAAKEFSAGSVVLSTDATDGIELCRLTARDVTNAGLVGHYGVRVERGHNLAREHFEEKSVGRTSKIGPTEAAWIRSTHRVILS